MQYEKGCIFHLILAGITFSSWSCLLRTGVGVAGSICLTDKIRQAWRKLFVDSPLVLLNFDGWRWVNCLNVSYSGTKVRFTGKYWKVFNRVGGRDLRNIGTSGCELGWKLIFDSPPLDIKWISTFGWSLPLRFCYTNMTLSKIMESKCCM